MSKKQSFTSIHDDGNRTIYVVLIDRKHPERSTVGFARCRPDETYDPTIGVRIAKKRAERQNREMRILAHRARAFASFLEEDFEMARRSISLSREEELAALRASIPSDGVTDATAAVQRWMDYVSRSNEEALAAVLDGEPA